MLIQLPSSCLDQGRSGLRSFLQLSVRQGRSRRGQGSPMGPRIGLETPWAEAAYICRSTLPQLSGHTWLLGEASVPDFVVLYTAGTET